MVLKKSLTDKVCISKVGHYIRMLRRYCHWMKEIEKLITQWRERIVVFKGLPKIYQTKEIPLKKKVANDLNDMTKYRMILRRLLEFQY